MGWTFYDSKVQAYIDKAMAKWSSYKPIDKQLNMAWSSLYQQRETNDPDGDDRELSAAEHYMYARWQVASGQTSEAVMKFLTVGYDPAKLAGYIPVVLAIRKIAGHSWSRPSTDSIRWGMRGCNDGVADKGKSA
jgi:hypothetical protein